MGDHGSVLVVPETPLAERLAGTLRADGTPTEAADAEAALARLGEEPPPCVVCLDGDDRSATELLAGVRERRPSVPAVVVGGDPALAGDRTRAVEGDADVEAAVDAVRVATDGHPAGAATGPADDAAGGRDRRLRAERDRFATLVEELPDPALVAGLESDPVVRYVNEAFEDAFGFDRDAIVGRTVGAVLVPDEGDAVALADLAEGEVAERTVERETADGVRTFLFRGRKATIDGRTEGFVVYTDVTERRQRAQQLDALHGVTRRLLAADDRAAVASIATEAAQDVLDLPAAGVFLAGPDGEQLAPAAYSDEVAALFDGDVPSYGPDSPVWPVFESGDHRVIPDAREAPDVETVDPIRSLLLLPLGDHGVLISSAPECREFSEAEVDLARLLAANTEAALDDAVHRAALRKRERALRTERDRLSALFENVPIPALRVDHRDGEPIVQEVNAAFEETFGYDAAAIVGENVDDFVMPDRRDVEPSVKDEVAAGRTVTREVRRATADGLRDFLLTTAPVDPGTTDGQAYGFYIDITERRQRQQRLRVLSRVLRHDIRNRMNVIDGNAELVRERASEAAVADPATRIQRAADELLSLSHRTRRLERTVAEAPDASPRPLSTVIDAVVAAAADRYPAATVRAEQAPDAAVHSADAVEVALTELIENAVEHADAASPTVSVRASTDPDGVTVEVSDDGPGVPEPERALVEGAREPTQLEHASGIGLWMVKWVATALGGEVRIEDREPRGTTVSLWLPCVAAD